MEGKQVYIVHGYGASPGDHWFPWLSAQLQAQGARVTTLALPDSGNPQAGAWQAALQAGITRHDGNTYLIAHSLGCIATLHFLQSLPADMRIGGVVLVSGFSEKLPPLPQIDGFVAQPLDAARLIAIVPQRAVIASRNDPIVPYALSVDLSRQLESTLVTVEQGGHFLGSEGFTTLPQAYDALAAMMQRP